MGKRNVYRLKIDFPLSVKPRIERLLEESGLELPQLIQEALVVYKAYLRARKGKSVRVVGTDGLMYDMDLTVTDPDKPAFQQWNEDKS